MSFPGPSLERAGHGCAQQEEEGWVDTRDGNSEIYVAKVDRSLTKIVPDRRISEAAGDSVKVQLAVRGKEVFVVWVDARQNLGEGNYDISRVAGSRQSLRAM